MPFTSHLFALPSNRSLHLSISTPSKTIPNDVPPPLFLVHGLGSSATAWLPALSFAPHVMAQHLIVALDLSGHGLSSVDPNASIASWAADLEAVVKEYAPGDARFALAGHSMGGPICSEVAAKYPARVAGMLFLNPGLPPFPAPFPDKFLARADLVSTIAGHSEVANTVSAASLSATSSKANPLLPAFIRHSILNTRAEGYAAACRALAAAQAPPLSALCGLACTVYIVSGSEDYIITDDMLEQWMNACGKKAKKIILEGVGHFSGLEDPAAIGKLFEDFLCDD